MCGIVGFFRTVNGKVGIPKRPDFMYDALMMDTLRGPHATGLFFSSMSMPRGVGYRKQACTAHKFLDDKEGAKCIAELSNARFAVGHNRWATIGRNDETRNAHPFKEKHITMVHNGTLRRTHVLPKSPASLPKEVTVDSHVLCHNFAAADDVVDVLEKAEGALALVWHDSRDGLLHFTRNKDRPLWFVRAGEKQYKDKIFFFGSEPYMVAAAMDRNNIEVGDFIELPEHEIWSFKPDSIKPAVKKWKPKPVPHQQNNNAGWYGNNNYGGGNRRRGHVHPTNFASKNAEVRQLLAIENLEPEDRLPFKPLRIVENSHVEGYIPYLELAAVVSPIPQYLSYAPKNQAKSDTWLVSPRALAHDDHEDLGGNFVICDFNKRYFLQQDWCFRHWDSEVAEEEQQAQTSTPARQRSATPNTVEKSREAQSDDDKEDHPSGPTLGGRSTLHTPSGDIPVIGAGVRVKGPGGKEISAQEYQKLVQKGCGIPGCNKVASVVEHRLIEWYVDPMTGEDCYFCPSCCEDASKLIH